MTFIGRAAIRIYKWRSLSTDDYFLLLAVASLAASFGLIITSMQSLFLFNDVVAGIAAPPVDMIQVAANTALYATIGELLAWTTVFTVKFSFLFVFRHLVRRIASL